MINLREKMLAAIKAHALGNIEKHKMNIEVYLNNSVGIGEHPDIIDAIEKELDVISHYHDQLEVIKEYIE